MDSPQVALIAFPGSVPEFPLDPCDTGDEAVGFDRAKNRSRFGIELMNLLITIRGDINPSERRIRPVSRVIGSGTMKRAYS
jgi:hypothetical protein